MSNNMSEEKEEAKILPDWKKVFVSREEFLKLVGISCGGLIALVIALPPAGFIFNYFLVHKRREWISLGAIDTFKTGETTDVVFEDPYSLPWDGVAGRRSAWLRRVDETNFVAFQINCTHLGCPVRWEEGADLFMCPCHGGVYYSDGTVAAGPPPAPLHHYPIRIVDGQVEIKVEPQLTEG